MNWNKSKNRRTPRALNGGKLRSLGRGFCLSVFAFFFLVKPSPAFVSEERLSLAKGLAHYAMGHMNDLLGLTERAILEYEKAMQFDEASYLTHLRLGVDYARLDMLSDAKRELEAVYQYNPEDLQSHYLLALIYSNQKEYDKAALEYEFILKKYAEVEPENVEIYGYLGQLYYSQQKFDLAIKQYETLLKLEPKNVDVIYILGSLYVDVGRTQEAIDVLKKAIEIDPNHDGCLNTLGYIYAELGKNLDEGESLIRRALMISPQNGAYLDSLGWLFYKKGQYQQALKTLQQADSIMQDPVIHDHMGEVLMKLNEPQKAIASWEKSLELLPGQTDIINKIEEVKHQQASAPAIPSTN